MSDDNPTEIFEHYRPKLMGIAYRFLGTMSDAEDIVQDVFLKWSAADRHSIRKPGAWLTKVCARRCLDVVKSVEKSRVDYVGSWLPEPIAIETELADSVLENIELGDSLTTAFLLALERLTPKERVAFLLREIFDSPYLDVAEVLDIDEAACRQLVSRAKKNISQNKVRNKVPAHQMTLFLDAFKHAITQGDPSKLQGLITQDIVIRADGGGKVPAIRQDISGLPQVLSFISVKLKRYWDGLSWVQATISGNPGFIIKYGNSIHAVVSFEFNDHGKTAAIFIMRNPDKLRFISSSNTTNSRRLRI